MPLSGSLTLEDRKACWSFKCASTSNKGEIGSWNMQSIKYGRSGCLICIASLLVSLEREMATHSSILVWRTPWTEELGGLKSMGLQRIRHDWATVTYLLDLVAEQSECCVAQNQVIILKNSTGDPAFPTPSGKEGEQHQSLALDLACRWLKNQSSMCLEHVHKCLCQIWTPNCPFWQRIRFMTYTVTLIYIIHIDFISLQL